jgi:hypothetical protein
LNVIALPELSKSLELNSIAPLLTLPQQLQHYENSLPMLRNPLKELPSEQLKPLRPKLNAQLKLLKMPRPISNALLRLLTPGAVLECDPMASSSFHSPRRSLLI